MMLVAQAVIYICHLSHKQKFAPTMHHSAQTDIDKDNYNIDG